jgi:hypothetical protein
MPFESQASAPPQQSALVEQGAPSEEQAGFGSVQSVYAVPMPEQQSPASLVSVPAPRHAQTPPLQLPVMQSLGAAHGMSFASFSWQVPSMQAPETQPSGPGHGWPSACFAVHVPASQKPDWHWPSPVHASPSTAGPHTPSMQRPDWQPSSSGQGIPSGCRSAQAPATQ